MEDKKVIFCCMAFQIFLLKRLRYAPSRLSISQYIPLRHLLSFGLECFYILWKRSSHTEMFLEKLVLKICSKFTGEHPCWSVISIKLQRNFIEIILQHGCSPVNLLHIFRTPFTTNTSGRVLLKLTWDVKKTFSTSSERLMFVQFMCCAQGVK